MKTVLIILIVIAVLVGAYSLGVLPVAEEVDDGTAEVTESFELSGSVQSDFWDGFLVWLDANLLWIILAFVVVWGLASFAKSKAKS